MCVVVLSTSAGALLYLRVVATLTLSTFLRRVDFLTPVFAECFLTRVVDFSRIDKKSVAYSKGRPIPRRLVEHTTRILRKTVQEPTEIVETAAPSGKRHAGTQVTRFAQKIHSQVAPWSERRSDDAAVNEGRGRPRKRQSFTSRRDTNMLV